MHLFSPPSFLILTLYLYSSIRPIDAAFNQQGVDRRNIISQEDADSFPLHLNVHSPNAQLKGAVPHFEEYGETVASVMKAQKRFKIPRPEEYSREIVKKNDIPRPEDDEDDQTVVHHKKKRSKVAKKQYVQYPQQQQQYAYNNPYASNLMASGDLYAQQNAGMMQFQQPQQPVAQQMVAPVANMAAATSHVQNLDGAIARPIVTEKVCNDQFALCSEYAKNNYCTDYEKQMRTQCRKSCNFCIPERSVMSSAVQSSTIDDDVSGSGEYSGSGEQEPMRRNMTTLTGNKRHDILQERANIPDRDESGDGSGSGSGDESGSGSGSGEADTDIGPIEVPIQQNQMQEFHFPSSRRDSFAGPSPQTDSEDGSGSASGSGDESGDSQDNNQQQVVDAPKPKVFKKSKIPGKPKIHPKSSKRSRIPNRPAQPVFYPKIDLKAIASSLAHYEEAALELAGEYPKISDSDVTEYTRSFIPHPESDDEIRANRNRQNIQIAKIITSERARKNNIPEFLKVNGDVKKHEKDGSIADTLDSVQQRFIVPGVEPTLNDYYAETGKLNPFDKKGAKNYKKSRIESYNANYDPYEYLRNMPAGASMEPIIDPHKRSSIPSDRSYPVFLMKVSPTDEAKYVEEKADRRGKIRHFNAEGVEINNVKYQQMLHGGHPEMESAVRAQLADARSRTLQIQAVRPQLPQFTIASKKATLPAFPPAPPPPAPAAFQQPSNQFENNFAPMQQNAMQQASLFPNNNQQFNYEQQPAPNNLRNKMFNAFFNVGANRSPEEGSGSGSDDFMSHMIPPHEQLVSTPAIGSSKVINLKNLLQTSTPQEKPQTERKDNIPPVMDTNNYLRSNLAELSPETAQYNSYQYQPSLNAGTYGPQYSFNTMPKTQETSWMRPNAQSELASAFTNQNSETRSNIQSQSINQQQKKTQIPQRHDIPLNIQPETKSKVTLPTLAELFQERQNEDVQQAKETAPLHSQQIEPTAPKRNNLHDVTHHVTVLTNKPADETKPIPSPMHALSHKNTHLEGSTSDEIFPILRPSKIIEPSLRHEENVVKKDIIPKSIFPPTFSSQMLHKLPVPFTEKTFKADSFPKSQLSYQPLQLTNQTSLIDSPNTSLNPQSESLTKATNQSASPVTFNNQSDSIMKTDLFGDDKSNNLASNQNGSTNALLNSVGQFLDHVGNVSSISNLSTPSFTPPSFSQATSSNASSNNSLTPKIHSFSNETNHSNIAYISNHPISTQQSSSLLSNNQSNLVNTSMTPQSDFVIPKTNQSNNDGVASWTQYFPSYFPSNKTTSQQLDIKTNITTAKNDTPEVKVGQSAAMNYLVPETEASIHPLSLTTADVKKPALYDSVLVKKNLIKEKPDLECGDEDWKGAEGDFGTFCYKNTNLKASFDDAVEHCKKLKGNMFSVLNAYENLYLQNHILTDSVDQQSWIGYHDKGTNGLWSWTDNSRSIYTNWGKEIDNKNNRHDCVYIDQEEGKWKDGNCTSIKPFLCKMKTESCPSEWNSLKLNSVVGCYKLFTDETTWEKAEQLCKADNAHLASVASEDEQTMIYQFHSSMSYWIGFNDRENEGDWQWSNRLTSSYTNWAEDAPNNGGYSCASVGKSGKWHDGRCNEKLNVVCKKKGPKPEKTDGYNEDGILRPVSRLLDNDATAPSHLYDDKDKSSPVVPLNFWPLLKDSKLGMAGNHPLAVNEPQNVKLIPGGVLLDGERSFLDAGDFHGHCIGDPEKCNKGFSVALQVKFDPVVLGYKKAHYVIDTSGRGRGFAIYIQNGKLHYKVVTDGGSWELETELTASLWQDIVLTWKNPSGLHVYVNGAYMDYTNITKAVDINTKMVTTTKLLIGRRSIDDRAPCTKMAVGSVVLFFKQLSVEDVPYAFTYGDTVVAYTRFFLTDIENSEIPGAAELVEKSITNIDGGIFIDGDTSDSVKPHAYLQLEDFPDVIYNVQKARHGFAVSFKIKFDQRDRDYKEPRYILDTGGHNGGMKGVSVYLVNDNMYFQVIRSSDEDILIWKVRVPIYTIRWQEVVMTWRLDKGLWIYVDGMFRGHTLSPQALPKDDLSTPKRLTIGRKNSGTEKSGAVFGFSSLAIFGRYLSRTDSEKVFGNTDNPYQGIIREVWKNTPGEELDKLEDNPDYPNNPTTIEIIENFDAPFNIESNYGSKLKGYFIAPETGNNTFYVSCSRACALFLSKDETGKTKKKILTLNKPTEHNVWNKYDNQSSEEIFLVAGKYYYLEAIQKGVDSTDSLSVGVKLPTGRYQRPINKENLQWRLPGNPHAGLVREVWYNIPGYSIEDLTSDSSFPNRPSSTEILDKFDAPFNYDDNYGSKISGYFHAPSSGEYTFCMATDSSGELWLSTNENSDSLKKIVSLDSWTDHNQWTKYPEQKSDKVFLVAKKYYYIRLYMKADKLGDCASVAVEMPDGTFEGPIKKKHLSWRLIGSNEGPGPKEVVEDLPKPVGFYPLNENTLKDMITKDIEMKNADVTKGPGDVPKSAIELKGSQSSYLEIANNGKLDAHKSITILTNIFPIGDNGPIVAYDPMGNGVHLWQYDKTQLFVRFTLRGSNGNLTLAPLATRVLQMGKWNQVGASYDNNTGVAQLWHDGKMVKSRNLGQVDLATDQNIRVGAVENDKRYFEGKISCLQIYDIALREKEIGELRVCPKSILKGNKIGQSAANNTHAGVSKSLLPEALNSLDSDLASGASEWFDEATDSGAETRIGDETEEELVAEDVKKEATRCQPNPCSNEGVCQDDDKKIDGYVCMCPAEFTGRRCQVSKQNAENPVVKRTAIPTINNNATNVANATIENATKTDESKEDISLLYQKLGCYKDDPSNHDLKTTVDLKRTTQEDCAKACAMADKSYSYFGLQNGTSCFCGKDHGKYGKLEDEACNITCNGNEAEKCGGAESNNVFFYGLGTNYTVKTFTGKPLGAGTDAKIYFELIGDRGSSDFRQLDPSPAKYEPGSEDIQTFLLPDLGKLKRMKILHDNTGTAPSWYLKKVQVTDEEGGSYEFPCGEWLSDVKGGGKLERELIAKSNIPTPS